MLSIILFTASCIEEYQLHGNLSETFKKELVIQGYILRGTDSYAYISYTVPFNDTDMSDYVSDAKVSIVSQDGFETDSGVYDGENQRYVIDTYELPENTLYALRVIIDGETYQSDFQPLQSSPEIDNVIYKERDTGVSIHVSTHDADTCSRYYMWSYEEDWEFHAEYNILNMGPFPIYNKDIYKLENSHENPYYYCWGHNTSKNIHIYSTLELKENMVRDVELLRIPVDDIRISYIYSILVKQWKLSKEAYDYFRTMEMYTENTGGLFAPMPAEILGNVKCLSNSDRRVKGYVLASQTTTKRIFIYKSDFKQITSEYSGCKLETPPVPPHIGWTISWESLMKNEGYVIYTKYGEIDAESVLYSNYCVDCRAVDGATKKRPDFWPNDHE